MSWRRPRGRFKSKASWRSGLPQVYLNRAASLDAIGFGSYNAYLESDLWRKIRDAVLKLRPYCFACGDDAEQIHHASYDPTILDGSVLAVEGWESFLYPVCSRCHIQSEFDTRGRKLRPDAATKNLKRMRSDLLTRADRLRGAR